MTFGKEIVLLHLIVKKEANLSGVLPFIQEQSIQKSFNYFYYFCVLILLQVDLDWLPDIHPTTLSLSFLNMTREDNNMEKLEGQDKDKKITYQLPITDKTDSIVG